MNGLFKCGVVGGLTALAAMTSQVALADDIKVGVIMPVSGPNADTGQPIVDGAMLAAQEINAAGGINGRQIQIISRDSQAKPDIGVAAVKELIAKEDVKLFIGEALSGVSVAVAQLADQEHVLDFNPSAGTKTLLGNPPSKFVFQQAPTTDAAAQRDLSILKEIGAKSVCFVGFDYVYSTDLFGAIKAGFEGTGIEVSNQYLVKLDTTDYSTLISQLMADSCDTIMGTLFGGGFIAFANQAQPFGLYQTKAHMVWEANMGKSDIAETLKGAYPDGMWTNAVDLWYVNDTDALKKYHEALAKYEGTEQTQMWAITGYTAMNFIAKAIEKAGSSDPEAVATALEGLSIESPLGTLTIDAKTHQVNQPEFYGPMVAKDGSDVKQMSPAKLLK